MLCRIPLWSVGWLPCTIINSHPSGDAVVCFRVPEEFSKIPRLEHGSRIGGEQRFVCNDEMLMSLNLDNKNPCPKSRNAGDMITSEINPLKRIGIILDRFLASVTSNLSLRLFLSEVTLF